MERREGEMFEDYRIRRKNERYVLDKHLLGVNIDPGNGTNRKQVRDSLNKSKHHGSQRYFARKRTVKA